MDKMLILECNQPTYFDVDDTLVKWNRAKASDPNAIAIQCPTSRQSRVLDENGIETDGLVKEEGSWVEYLAPHKVHIEHLKLHKLRGHTVIVWSAGGWEWAEAVVKALKLEKYVDLVIEKPVWFYDDLTPNEFMGKRYFMEDKEDV